MNKILILGAGALGSNITTNLAVDLKNKTEISVLDFDKIEVRNYQAGTQFYRKDQLGMPKVKALGLNIYNWFGIIINTLPVIISRGHMGFAGGNKIFKKDLIIDVFDNYESRKFVYEECQRLGVPCLHVGFSPKMTFEACWNEDYVVPDDSPSPFDICEADGVRSFIQFVSAFTCNVIQKYLKTGEKHNYIGNAYSITKVI